MFTVHVTNKFPAADRGPASRPRIRSAGIGILFTALLFLSCLPGNPEADPDFFEPYYDIAVTGFDEIRAYEHVKFITQFWRVAGNGGYNECLDYVADVLRDAGFEEGDQDGRPTFRIESSTEEILTWQPLGARLTVRHPVERSLHTYEETPVFLAENSFSQDLTGELVFVPAGSPVLPTVANKIVLSDRPISDLFEEAVQEHHAAGVISAYLPSYNRPADHPDLVKDAGIPLDKKAKSFGLNVSMNSLAFLKKLAQSGKVKVDIHIATEIRKTKVRTLVAEIPGADSAERLVAVAHLDHYKPGANDNASGAATLLEMAASFNRSIASGVLDRPKRTLTFIWGDEYRGPDSPGAVGFWKKNETKAFGSVLAGFSLDMVGEKVELTGGSFLIEKVPDPSVMYTRLPDQHTEWGVTEFPEDELFGSFLNDYFYAVCARRAKDVSWVVKTNPWAGGSDHDFFISHGVPAVLAWHFTDVFYHTSGDDLDAVDPAEMKNVGVSIMTAMLGLANLESDHAIDLIALVERKGLERLDNERKHAIKLINGKSSSLKRERHILRLWEKWYLEAADAAGAMAPDPGEDVKKRVREAQLKITGSFDEALLSIEGATR